MQNTCRLSYLEKLLKCLQNFPAPVLCLVKTLFCLPRVVNSAYEIGLGANEFLGILKQFFEGAVTN